MLLGIIQSALFVLLGFLLKIGISYWLERSSDGFHKFTGFEPGAKSRLRVVYGLIKDSNNFHRYAHEGDVSAICAAIHFLSSKRLGPISSICSTSALSDYGNWLELLSISGPVWNLVSREILSNSVFDIAFSTGNVNGVNDDIMTVSAKNGNIFTKLSTTRSTDGIPRECYGLVVSVHNPRRGDRRLRHHTVVAGLSTLGTYGALQWLEGLADDSNLPAHDFGGDTGIRDRFALLRVVDSSPEGFSSYGSDSLAPSSLSIELLHLESGDQLHKNGSIREVGVNEFKKRLFQ